MKRIITFLSITLSLLVFGQAQISASNNGQNIRIYIDGVLQHQNMAAYMRVVNVPEGNHTVKLMGFNNQYLGETTMYFLNQKAYKFVPKFTSQGSFLVLSDMQMASNVYANGVNVVNFNGNGTFTNNNSTLNSQCTCGNCYGNMLNCANNTTQTICSCGLGMGTHLSNCAMYQNTGNTGGSVTIHHNTNGGTVIHHNTNTNTVTNTGKHPQMMDYNGRVGCYKHRINLQDLLNRMKQEAFSEDKAKAAKLALKHYSISVDDLIVALKKIQFDDDRLELAKYAYDHAIDVANYYKVGGAFTFSSGKDALNEYINNK